MQGDSVHVLRIDFLLQALLVACISFVYTLIKLLVSGEYYGQQLKRWIFRGGTPLKTFCFLIPSALRWCGGGWWWQGLTDGWPISTQTTAAALFSSTPSYALYYPATLLLPPHTSCTVLPSSTQTTHSSSRLYRSKYALRASKAGRSSDQYSPSTPTPQHSAWPPCTGQLYYLSSYSCPFLMDHWLRRASPVFPDL